MSVTPVDTPELRARYTQSPRDYRFSTRTRCASLSPI